METSGRDPVRSSATSKRANGNDRQQISRSGPSRRRWLAVPAVAAVVLGAFGGVAAVAGAGSPPNLPSISANTLLNNIKAAKSVPFSATVTTTSDLGLPNVSSLAPGSSTASGFVESLLSGATSENVWVGAPGQLRIAVPVSGGEQDFVLNGKQAWQWNSTTQTATRVTLPSRTSSHAADKPAPAVTATAILNAVQPSTRVFVSGTAWVAKQKAYQLVLAPKVSTSLVADIVISVDSRTWMPLEVQILARNQSAPAFSVGYGNINYTSPSPANFNFQPPAGAKLKNVQPFAGGLRSRGASDTRGATMGAFKRSPTERPASGLMATHKAAPGSAPARIGKGWSSVVVVNTGSLNPVDKRLLLGGAQSISGPWGTAKLVKTSLVDALVLPSGQTFVGAVQPSVLEAAASQAK